MDVAVSGAENDRFDSQFYVGHLLLCRRTTVEGKGQIYVIQKSNVLEGLAHAN